MKRIFTLRFMLVSLFAVMGMAMNAKIIEYTDGVFKYSLETKTKTATLSKYSGSARKVTIPESVTHKAITYSVTSLGNVCFANCQSSSIIIPSSVTSLGDECFYNCKSIKTMTCEIPRALYGKFFSNTPIEQATLYVPESSLLSYQSTWPWRSFGTILPITTTGIGEIATEGDACIDAIYDIGGKRINGSARGLNIIRMSDGTTRKVLK